MTRQRKHNKEYERNRYMRLKTKGICTSCKGKPAALGYVRCAECNEKGKGNNDLERKRYADLKAKGICPSCKNRKAVSGKVQCECCKAEVSEYKRKLILRGICRQCQTNEAEPGIQNCWDCAEKSRKASQARRNSESAEDKAKRLAYNREYKRMRRIKFILAGLCTRCGKRRPQADKQICLDCVAITRRERDARKTDTLLRNERPDYGLCYICGESKLEGKRLCARCNKTSLANLAKAGATTDKAKHPWRMSNNLVFAKATETRT